MTKGRRRVEPRSAISGDGDGDDGGYGEGADDTQERDRVGSAQTPGSAPIGTGTTGSQNYDSSNHGRYSSIILFNKKRVVSLVVPPEKASHAGPVQMLSRRMSIPFWGVLVLSLAFAPSPANISQGRGQSNYLQGEGARLWCSTDGGSARSQPAN
jgi:hypothetical protein